MNPTVANCLNALAAWLADYYLMATILLGAVFLARRWLRQPAFRLWVAWIVLVELGLLAFVCWLPGVPRIPLLGTATPAAIVSLPDLATVPPRKPGDPETAFSVSSASADPESVLTAAPALPFPALLRQWRRFSWQTWVGGGFLLGIGLTSLWLGWGGLATVRLRRSAAPASPAMIARLTSLIGREIGDRPLPSLLLSPRIHAAMAMGVLRPAILLPAAIEQAPAARSLRAILRHEWAHIRNRDLWLLALGRGLLLLLFAHPLYWWLRAMIRNDQEALADAVAASGSPHDYALELVDWARGLSGRPFRHAAAAVGIWESPSQLTRRVAMLLDETFCVQTSVSPRWKRRASGCLVLLGLVVAVFTWQSRPSIGQQAGEGTAAQKAKSLTIYPVVITSSDPAVRVPADLSKRVTPVVGMGFERAGFKQIKLSEAGIAPPEKADIKKLGAVFGQFVAAQKITTDYALFCEFVGIPGKGVDAVRLVVVDPQGTVVLSELADKKALAIRGEKKVDLMVASVYPSTRLRELLRPAGPEKKQASGEKAEAASEGKITEAWNKESGVPTKEEREAMESRLKTLASKIKTSTVAVYPIRVGQNDDANLAGVLAKQLTKQGVGTAEAVDVVPEVKITGDYNGVKILWNAAKAFQQFLRKNPPNADYALFAHYLIGENADHKPEIGGVHIIICDREGNWVAVRSQNSHSTDFQRINPKSAEECNRVVVETLQHSQRETAEPAN
jgi:Zn-dependent protease with chaperone function